MGTCGLLRGASFPSSRSAQRDVLFLAGKRPLDGGAMAEAFLRPTVIISHQSIKSNQINPISYLTMANSVAVPIFVSRNKLWVSAIFVLSGVSRSPVSRRPREAIFGASARGKDSGLISGRRTVVRDHLAFRRAGHDKSESNAYSLSLLLITR